MLMTHPVPDFQHWKANCKGTQIFLKANKRITLFDPSGY